MSYSDGLVRVPNPFMNMLISTHVRDIRPKRSVLYLRSTDTMKDAMDALRNNSVLSFPVLDEYGECLGIIDGVDVITYLHANESNYTLALSKTIENYINSYQTTFYIPVFSTTTLYAVITILAPGCHRTLVFTNEDEYSIHSMFSESDLTAFVYYLLKHDDTNKPLQRIGDLPICCFSGSRSKPTYVAYHDEPLHTAFTHVLNFRQGKTASATISTDEGESFDYRTPLVAVFHRETGILLGHIDANALGRTSGVVNIDITTTTTQTTTTTHANTDTNTQQNTDVHNILSPINITVGEYLAKFTPECANTWVVPENITLRGLLNVLVKNKLHHVWIVNRGVEAQPLKSLSSNLNTTGMNTNTTTTTTTSTSTDNIDIMQNNGVLGVVTLNDVLRWVARDNLWLKVSELPPE